MRKKRNYPDAPGTQRMTDAELSKKLGSVTQHNWQMLPLHVEFQGAHVISSEE